MSVNVYKQANVMTTTQSLKGLKRCDGCDARVTFLIRKSDNKWYCTECADEKNPLIVAVTDGSED